MKVMLSLDIQSSPVDRNNFVTDCDVFVSDMSVKRAENMDKTLTVHPTSEPTKDCCVDSELTSEDLRSVFTCTAESSNNSVGSQSV